jgi:oxygen-independent coproporphyrinogen-3 oxidase
LIPLYVGRKSLQIGAMLRGDTSAYVHFPWCAKKCPYCDFATRGIDPSAVPSEAYADALVREIDARAAGLTGRRLVSVFFGGGTPSLFAPEALGRVLTAIRGAFEAEASDLEVTVECNPSSFDRAKAAALRLVGVNRVSLGLQSLDDEQLRFLGRLHDAEGAVRALTDAVAEVPRVSGDLMFGMPGQTPEQLSGFVERIVAAGARHVSAYALTVEPGTRFGELHRRRLLPLATEDDYASMFETAEAAFDALGFEHYEVSNYAVPGEESRHNAHYWRGGDYLGLGAAAVGCLASAPGEARRYRNHPDPSRYMAAPIPPGCEESEERLGPDELLREALMLGLRTREGLDVPGSEARAGRSFEAERERALERRLAAGDVVRDGAFLRIPRARWLQLDSIVADLF